MAKNSVSEKVDMWTKHFLDITEGRKVPDPVSGLYLLNPVPEPPIIKLPKGVQPKIVFISPLKRIVDQAKWELENSMKKPGLAEDNPYPTQSKIIVIPDDE